MGYGDYSHEAHAALLRARSSLPIQEVFRETQCHPLMNPKGVLVRECRDSDDHPDSLGVVFALDVTGSMGDIPRELATVHLPGFMKVLTESGVANPQVLFMAVGDAYSDTAPLQVGQFESTAELMDGWLTRSYLEGAGGPYGEESYELALYFLAQHTEMDCAVKRGRRGYAFLTGDEDPYPALSPAVADGILGDRLDEDIPVEEIVAEVQKHYHPFFLIPNQRRRSHCEPRWRGLLGDHVICLDAPEDTAFAAAGAIALAEGRADSREALSGLLEGAGLEHGRLRRVVKALTPFADSLGRR